VKEMAVLRSPNELVAAAREQMLDGREPESREDWVRIMNFLAFNVHPVAAVPTCRLMAKMYDMPLSEQEIEKIVAFQLAKKE
jgi:hypothetical protein